MNIPRLLLLGVALGLSTSTASAVSSSPSDTLIMAQAERPLVSGERVRLQKMIRDMDSAMQTLRQGGAQPFQDPAYLQKWQQSLARYENQMQRYPQANDPDVQAATAKLNEYRQLIAGFQQQGSAQTDSLGDVQGQLAAIESALRQHRAPAWLPAPFSEDEARQWVNIAATAKQTALQAQRQLQTIAAKAHLPANPGTVQQGAPYDKNDVNRLSRFAASIVTDVDAAVAQTQQNLKTRFDAQDRELEYYRKLDPTVEQDRLNAYLAEDAEARIFTELDRQSAVARSLANYQLAFGQTVHPTIQGRIDEIAQLRTRYAEDRLAALGDSRLPSPASDDAARLAIAERILSEPDYAFGEHGPIVLTTPEVVEREKQVSRAEIKDVDFSISGDITFSGTETTWQYRWQEFKFATPIKDTETGNWHIWWITAKNYSSGWERTPIGQWVSGAAVKGSLIPQENF